MVTHIFLEKLFPALKVNGVKVRFSPHLLLRRVDKTNKQPSGAFMLRYSKRKALAADVGGYQSAAAFGLLKDYLAEEGSEADKNICVTLDAFTGNLYPAPGSADVRQHEGGLPVYRPALAECPAAERLRPVMA